MAEKVKKGIEGKTKKKKLTEKIKTELFVGARRIHERSKAEDRLKALGFIEGGEPLTPPDYAGAGGQLCLELNGDKPPALERPVFLISTSAGEVGVDLDADHMVCDLVAWERMVQRLGRVNRKGGRETKIRIVAFKQDKKDIETLKQPFNYLPKNENKMMDGSPGALLELKRQSEENKELENILQQATTPHPLYPALTRALVDAWSMTSLKQHAGRPEVITPWLRGWLENDKPQSTVVWRKYLPVRTKVKAVTKKEVDGFFEAAQPHLSEKLETETDRVSGWLIKRAASLLNDKDTQLKSENVVAFALAPDGTLRKSFQLKYLADENNKKDIEENITGATLVLDVRLGGLNENGLLDDDANNEDIAADNNDKWDVGFRIRCSEGDNNGSDPADYRFATRQSDEGEDLEYLFITTDTTEESRAISTRPQRLDEHQCWAEKCARRIAEDVGLAGDFAETLAIAARLHDEGKRAGRWQRGFKAKSDGKYAKTKGPLDHSILGGYRHEFGSLPYAEKDDKWQQLPNELQELVLHLIAAHHGYGRPVIATKGCDDAPPSQLQRRARDVALRFARLQKQWGPWGLAWWEALLRAADQQASRENDNRGDANG